MDPLPFRFPLLALLLLLCPLAARAEEDAKPAFREDIYALPKFEVKGNAICSFGFGVKIGWNAKTQAIGAVIIDSVAPGSTAERLGLQPGDEILAINGRKVTSMTGGARPGIDIFDLLVNRPVGENIDLEVAVRAVKRVSLKALP